MAKTAVERSHDAMVAFFKKVITHSEKVYGGPFGPGRTPTAQRHYETAKRLVAQAESLKAR